MGTRHLIVVQKNRDIKVAQYCQWDGYPSGNGVELLKFLKKKKDELFEAVEKCCFESVYTKVNEEDFYTFNSRDLSWEVLDNIILSEKDKIVLRNSYSFGKESLYCEWIYVINYDDNKLEVYKGFNKNPMCDRDRFYVEKPDVTFNEYYGCVLVKEYPLDVLPSDEDFLKDFANE